MCSSERLILAAQEIAEIGRPEDRLLKLAEVRQAVDAAPTPQVHPSATAGGG